MVATFNIKSRTVRLVRNPVFHEWSADAQPSAFPNSITITWSPDQFGVSGAGRAVGQGRADPAVAQGSPPIPRSLLNSLALQYASQLRLSLLAATWYLFPNTRVPPFNDVRVRRAVSYAFKRATFGPMLTSEYSTTCNILPPNYPGYHPSCAYGAGGAAGLAKARAVVRASGTAGRRVVVWTPTPVAFEGNI